MKIAIGCDHGGFELKQLIIQHLSKNGYEVKDFGCFDSTSVDYPDYAYPVACAVVSGAAEKGILICGTGIGMSIAANKGFVALCAAILSRHMQRLSIMTVMFLPWARVWSAPVWLWILWIHGWALNLWANSISPELKKLQK